MKYYSERLNKVYDTVEELDKAEKSLDEKEAKEKALKEERAKKAKEVEDAYKDFQKKLNAFIKDYGSYHTSIKTPSDLFDLFFPF